MSKRTQPSNTQATPADGEQPTGSNPDSQQCWGCGSEPARRGDRLGPACIAARVDPHWIPCSTPGCSLVAHRRVRGQQIFHCPRQTPREDQPPCLD